MTPYNRAIFLLNPSKRKDRKGEVSAQSCLKYSSRVCIILVLEKTKSVNVSRGKYAIKTGMPRLTITNHSELYPEVLNSLNEMSEYLHDKIRKHATKQARRNHSVFPCSSANFLSCGLLGSLKPRPNDCNMPTQHIATLLGATCCLRLATVLQHVARCWVLLAQI